MDKEIYIERFLKIFRGIQGSHCKIEERGHKISSSTCEVMGRLFRCRF